MQRFVLDDAQGRLSTVEQGMTRAIEITSGQHVFDLIVDVGCKRTDDIARRPQRFGASRGPCGGRRFVRVYAPPKKVLKPRVDTWTTQPLLHEGVETEAR